MPPDQQFGDIFPSYNTGAFAPMGATYTDWLQSQLGAQTSPWAQQYAQTFAPWAQLQYMASGQVPGNIQTTGSANPYTGNPFGSYLMDPGYGGLPDPTGATGWTGLAGNVLGALGADPAGATEQQLRLQERFGTSEQAAGRQAALAAAPIVSNTPFALRGETQNILNRLYDRWLVRNPESGTGAGYLEQAARMQDPTKQYGVNNVAGDPTKRLAESLWGRFGVT